MNQKTFQLEKMTSGNTNPAMLNLMKDFELLTLEVNIESKHITVPLAESPTFEVHKYYNGSYMNPKI